MEYNGLTFEFFRQCLGKIEDFSQLNDEIANALLQYSKKNGEYCEFYFPAGMNDLVTLLGILLHDKHDWIGYWCYERNFGKRTDMGAVTGEDGTMYPFETAEHLWNLLAAERRERGE